MSRRIACITLDVEADFLDPNGHILLFDDAMLLDKYVSIIRANGVKVTAFLVTSLLDRYGAAFKRLGELVPVEFAIHSHRHDTVNPCTPGDIEESVDAFRKFAGHKPAGYRAPFGHITNEGLNTLLELGIRYDSSIFPSMRLGRFGYNNIFLPHTPFKITHGAKSIIEVPFGSLSGLRLIFSLSYVKLLGWRTYEVIMKLFPLPDHIAVLAHPHDFYFHLLEANVHAAGEPLLRRNARQAFDLFEKMIKFLKGRGYEFMFLGELCDFLETKPLAELPLDRVVAPN
jgi:peptidoglycan/xylan/chitin deacetylase (PgdA/CDA1 family)